MMIDDKFPSFFNLFPIEFFHFFFHFIKNAKRKRKKKISQRKFKTNSDHFLKIFQLVYLQFNFMSDQLCKLILSGRIFYAFFLRKLNLRKIHKKKSSNLLAIKAG